MENFKLGNLIGSGKFSKVYFGKMGDKDVAIKKIDKNWKYLTKLNLNNEAEILKNLNFPYIIKFYESFEDCDNIYHVLEYIDSGDLFSRIQNYKTMSEKEALHYVKQISRGLSYLHLKGIIHGDIKPENILLDKNDNIKICDFGHAIPFKKGEKFKKLIGTIYYLAPEIVKKEGYDYRIDIWTVGIIYYEMLAKVPPFFVDSDEEVFNLIKKCKVKYPKTFSKKVIQNISKILVCNPEKRISLCDVLLF